MHRYEYINTVQDATSINVDTVTAANIYTIDRGGIGIQQSAFEGGTVEGTAYQFLYRASTPGAGSLVGWYFIVLSDLVGFAGRLVTVEIGSVVQLNTTYTLTIDDQSITYVSTAGQTATNVRNALVTAINGATWDDTVTATAVSTNQIEIVIDNIAAVSSAARSLTIYKSGYYAEFALNGGPVKEYLIEQNSSGVGYPTLGTLDSSYLYADLIPAPAGIESLLYTPAYTQDFYIASDPETVDITDSPEVVLPASGRCLYYDSKIYFGDPMNIGERINMIVI